MALGTPARHFDLGKPIPGRDEVTRYFASRYAAESILDIGCGSGPVWPIFAAAGMRVTGIECVEPGGVFCLIWPPPKAAIVSGHVHVFNLGLMLYNLVRLGVDCRRTEMVRCGYCLAIMGRYRRFEIPALTHNEGDLDVLGPYFGCPVYQGFDGDAPLGIVDLPVDR